MPAVSRCDPQVFEIHGLRATRDIPASLPCQKPPTIIMPGGRTEYCAILNGRQSVAGIQLGPGLAGSPLAGLPFSLDTECPQRENKVC